MRIVVWQRWVACSALLLCGCPAVQPAVDGAPDAGPDAGPDLRLPDDARLPDRWVYDPDHRLFDIGCQTRLVSVTSTGKHLNRQSFRVSISRDGRLVVFLSQATNLVPGEVMQVYAHDLVTGKTELVSKSSGGVPANADNFITSWAVNRDGRYVAFYSRATNLVSQQIKWTAVFLRDRQAGTTTLVANGINGSSRSTISDDGQTVSFYSYSNDLVPGDTNDQSDIFVKDLRTGKIVRASVADDGSLGKAPTFSHNQSSGDGRRVVFESKSQLTSEPLPQPSLVTIYVRDLVKQRTYLVSRTGDGKPTFGLQPSISADGTRVVFRRNNDDNIYLADVDLGKSTRVSSTTGGQVVSDPCRLPAISDNGRFVTFCSASPKIVAGDSNGATDVFLMDLQAKTTVRVSVAADGSQGVGRSSMESLSSVADSGRVAFESLFYNLVGPREGILSDVFVRPGCP